MAIIRKQVRVGRIGISGTGVGSSGQVVWTGTPDTTFTVGQPKSVYLGALVSNYNPLTDVFAFHPATPPSAWLSLTGVGGVTLQGDGSQSVAGTHTINIGVSRSGGAYVYTGPLTVTVNAAPETFGTIDDFALEGRAVLTWTDPQQGGSGVLHGKHTYWQFCPADGKIYGYGGDGVYPRSSFQSGTMRFGRVVFSADGNSVTYDQFYPHWGIAEVEFPSRGDMMSWVWDEDHGCFWNYGGFAWPLPDPDAALNIGIPASPSATTADTIWKFHVTGAQAGNWEKITITPPKFFAIGNGPGGFAGIYHPPSKCLMWMTGNGDDRIYWRNVETGAVGRVSSIGTPKPNETWSDYPNVLDPETNELIQLTYSGATKGIWAMSLANFPASSTARQLWSGFEGFPGSDESPLFIRGTGTNRKLYHFGAANRGTGIGNGIGFYELDLTTYEMKQAAAPYFELKNTIKNNGGLYPHAGADHTITNEGAYDPVKDRLFVTTQKEDGGPGGGSALIFRWSPPSWTPAAGELKRITVDITGTSPAATTSQSAVHPSDRATAPYRGNGSINNWVTACYAKDISTNGAMLFWSGGDGDYWGTEVYAFDFDTRRWHRLTEPYRGIRSKSDPEVLAFAAAHPEYTGNQPYYEFHYQLPGTEESHFNVLECEHGPAVADFGNFGLLPIESDGYSQKTVPGVPHNYDGLVYLPGSAIGNRRGAMVVPLGMYAFPLKKSDRAHYFDLDRQAWGRFSNNVATAGASKLSAAAYDSVANRIYHQHGYIDVATHTQNANGTWYSTVPINASIQFDPIRRLLLWADPAFGSAAAGTMRAASTDPFTGAASPITLEGETGAGDLWVKHTATEAGLVYVPEADQYFLWQQRVDNPEVAGMTTEEMVKTIWRITPPAAGLNPFTNNWRVRKLTMNGDTITASGGHGTFKRIQWIPPLKCLALHPNYGGSMYLYKPEGF